MAEAPPRGVLITRPEPGAAATARRVAALGWVPVVAPMLEIRPRRTRLPDAAGLQAVLVTSAAAIPDIDRTLHDVRLFAVGDATADAAKAAGFAHVASAGADAAALAALVASRCSPGRGPLLLASGRGQGMRLAADLRARGFRVLRRAVYDTRPAAALPREAIAALEHGTIAFALFFSPATARAFVDLAALPRRATIWTCIDAIAISPATQAALAPLPWRRIRVASSPNQDELLAQLT